MRSTLHLKFIIIYVIIGFISLFSVATLSDELIENFLEYRETTELYENTSLISSGYLHTYFSPTTGDFKSSTENGYLLQSMRLTLGASIWIVDTDGYLLDYSKLVGTATPPQQIQNFDPVEAGNDLALIGNYHNYLDSQSITVIAPIISGFDTLGYTIVHKPYNSLLESKNYIMRILYFTTFLLYLFAFVILIAIHFLIYIPLRKITEAATQYASGNLSHEIPIQTHDEMGYLSVSLNYMSSQLRDMEDYQKKFIGNVSHDFRSPLTSIKGYIEALADGTIPIDMQEKYFRIILFETERLTDLTKDLLTLNEFDTKELLLNKEHFDIHNIIKNVARSFEGRCTSKHISIELVLEYKSLTVYADKRKIQQVLYNLLDNAIKFSHNNSSIIIETNEINDKVFISVKDYGSGIPKESLTKIWDRFYKQDQSRGKDKKGTGLGLSIVKEIIQTHNEHINVISTEDVGTEFIFSLSTNTTNN